jgi:hypothetical protein
MGDLDDVPLRTHLDPGQTATLAAMVDAIVPTDDYPGGVAAGVLGYFDIQFSGELAAQLGHYRLGLDAVDAEARAVHGRALGRLRPDERHHLLQAIESGNVQTRWPIEPQVFFGAVVGNVMEGFYGDPGNGGNRNSISWQMIGFRVSD